MAQMCHLEYNTVSAHKLKSYLVWCQIKCVLFFMQANNGLT